MSKKLKLTEQFRLRFAQLRSATNNSPQTLLNFFKEKPEFELLACDVERAAELIEKAANYRKVHPQVEETFISEFKDYSYRWRTEVAYVTYCSDMSTIAFEDDDFEVTSFEDFKKTFARSSGRTEPDTYWETTFDPSRHDGAAAIRNLLALAMDEAQFRKDNASDEADDFVSNTHGIGIEAFEYFEKVIGIDVASAFRRWNMLPAVFVPKHVSDRHGLTEKGSLYALLGEAIRAYIAGAPAAAIAMCRAVLEVVLRDHYLRGEVDGKDKLGVVIHLAAARYEFLCERKMRGLSDTANKVLHDYAGSGAIALEDDQAILKHFKDLKYYIEKAPVR
jgi:hypothetical protein